MSRRLGVGAPIAISLIVLALAVTRHDLSANDSLVRSMPADFVVGSARDAGPDTLRDAILAADRLSSHAHIIITAQRIEIESALPALVNPHGMEIDAAKGAGIIDAARLASGAALQINSPATTLRGLSIVGAHATGLIVNAPGARLDSLSISNCGIGVLVHPAAGGSAVQTSTFRNDGTAMVVEPGARDVTVNSSIFQGNTRSGLWFVGGALARSEKTAADAAVVAPALRVIDSVFDANASGIVLANQSALIQKSRFLHSVSSAVLVLGGAARVEDSEIRGSAGTAVSVTSGRQVALVHNTFIDNSLTAIMVRDSDAIIERNTFTHDGLGVVAMGGQSALAVRISDNLITGSTADAITVIGDASVVQRNRVIDNRGAGLRTLDLIEGGKRLKAAPRLDANVFRGNGIDQPARGEYIVSEAP